MRWNNNNCINCSDLVWQIHLLIEWLFCTINNKQRLETITCATTYIALDALLRYRNLVQFDYLHRNVAKIIAAMFDVL